jgi:hypothetical protein
MEFTTSHDDGRKFVSVMGEFLTVAKYKFADLERIFNEMKEEVR